MTDTATINDLFELAITSEKASEQFYRGLETRFTHIPAVAQFWEDYACDEATHVLMLVNVRNSLSQARLAAPANPHILAYARKAAQFSVVDALNGVNNLEDAYRLAQMLEGSEATAVFEFLVTGSSMTQLSSVGLAARLQVHLY